MTRNRSVIALLVLSLSNCLFSGEAAVASAPTYYDVSAATGNAEGSSNTVATTTSTTQTTEDTDKESKMSYGSKIAEGRQRRNKIKGALKRRHLTAGGVEELNPLDDEEMEHFLRYLQFSTPVSKFMHGIIWSCLVPFRLVVSLCLILLCCALLDGNSKESSGALLRKVVAPTRLYEIRTIHTLDKT